MGVLDNLVILNGLRRQYEEAVRCGQAALEIFADLQDELGRAGVVYRLCVLRHQQGEYNEALQLASTSRTLFLEAGAVFSEIKAALAECYSRHMLGEYAVAEYELGEVVNRARNIGDRKGEAAACLSLANMYLSGQPEVKFESGLTAARRAETLLREIGGSEHMLADTLHMLTLAYLQVSDLDEAMRPAHEAQVLFHRIGDKSGEADILRIIANMELSLLYREHDGHDPASASAASAKGKQYLRTVARHQTSALRNAERAVALARKAGGGILLAQSLHSLGQVYNVCGAGDKALAVAQEAEALFQQAQDQNAEANAMVVAADACVIKGDRTGATEFAERAASLFSTLGDTESEAFARSVLPKQRSAMQEVLAVEDAAAAESGAGPSTMTLMTAMPLERALELARGSALDAIGTGDDDITLDDPLMDIGLIKQVPIIGAWCKWRWG